ncbi:MAG: hypothetical protein JWO25_673, partial [Alphaproteobacteria bacterium]|nr:hypothetical protein [Alphaproteobacteria bacterium]
MRILVVLIALLAMLPGCRKPAVAAEPIASATFVEWRMEKGPGRWTRNGLTTTLASRTVEGVERPVWAISAPGMTSARIMF